MIKKATVSYELGRTINLGDFENVKISIGIDIRTDVDELDADYKRAVKWVGNKLKEEEEKWKVKK